MALGVEVITGCTSSNDRDGANVSLSEASIMSAVILSGLILKSVSLSSL